MVDSESVGISEGVREFTNEWGRKWVSGIQREKECVSYCVNDWLTAPFTEWVSDFLSESVSHSAS